MWIEYTFRSGEMTSTQPWPPAPAPTDNVTCTQELDAGAVVVDVEEENLWRS